MNTTDQIGKLAFEHGIESDPPQMLRRLKLLRNWPDAGKLRETIRHINWFATEVAVAKREVAK